MSCLRLLQVQKTILSIVLGIREVTATVRACSLIAGILRIATNVYNVCLFKGRRQFVIRSKLYDLILRCLDLSTRTSVFNFQFLIINKYVPNSTNLLGSMCEFKHYFPVLSVGSTVMSAAVLLVALRVR